MMNMNNKTTGGMMFSPATLFSFYTSISAFYTLFQQAYRQFVPSLVRRYIEERIQRWFTKPTLSRSKFNLVIEPTADVEGRYGHSTNQVFEAVDKYLCTKLSKGSSRLKVNRKTEEDVLNYRLAQGEQFKETFEGIKCTWRYIIPAKDSKSKQLPEAHYFELSVDEEHKEKVLKAYLPSVLSSYVKIKETEKQLRLFTLGFHYEWTHVAFNHPFTFDSLAMDPQVKKSITHDLDRFVKRKEYYKRVGKAWKRGYLLYGPPGTGKSSLIAAMANYLKFDVYDLQLSRVISDSTLRSIMLATNNKSILVVEDVDCTLGLPKVRKTVSDNSSVSTIAKKTTSPSSQKISLSGLLNFLDGLWSSCGDERIIIFTTNNKEKLDPALLRPGRMDLHIHMSYLTMPAFEVLAYNYLDIHIDEQHPLFGEIETLVRDVNVTAAQIAEEMMRAEDAEMGLQGVIQLLRNMETKGAAEIDDSEVNKIDKQSDKRTGLSPVESDMGHVLQPKLA